jgi:hypothetical protein
MKTKLCSCCEKELSIRNFTKRKTSSDDYTSICRKCRSIKRNRDKHWHGDQLLCIKCGSIKPQNAFNVNKDNAYRGNRDRFCIECKVAQREKRRICNRGDGSLARVLLERFLGARDRSKRKGMTIDIDVPYLTELWDKQAGLCAITKIPMTLAIFKGRTPTNVSIDRISSSEGYIKGNIQLICMAVNQMKSDLSYEQLLMFCEKTVENKIQYVATNKS